MSYPRNAASPPHFLVGYVYQISDGAVQTSGVSARVKTGTGSWGTAAGTLDCDTTSGAWTYTPTQGETNAEAFSVSLYKANCSGVGMTVITTKSATSGYAGLDWGQVIGATTSVNLAGTTVMKVNDAVTLPASASINITGNITGNLSGSVGSVTGAVGSVTGNVGGSVASVTGAVGSVTGNVGGSVASVTGNVGGNVTGSVGSVATGGITSSSFAAGAITASAIAASALNGKGDWQTVIWTSASATVNLSGTTIKAVTDSVAATVSDKTGYKLASDGLAAISAWTVAITGNLTGNVTGSVNSVATTVSANVVQWNSGSLPTIPTAGENADAVWDEAYAGHTAAGSFGKLMDTLRKSNYVTDGTVASGQTPTTTVFRSNLTAPSGTYDHQTMLFLTGTLAGESRPIDTYSATNGTFTLAEPLTSAPTVGDEFVLLPDHVHPITAIAAGVRTELQTELGRIDVTVGSRLADASYTAPLTAAGTRSALGLASANLDTQLDALPTAIENADALLGRSVANSQSTAAEWSLCTLVLAALESTIAGSTWTIYRTDGTTVHATKTVTTDAAADPVTGVA